MSIRGKEVKRHFPSLKWVWLSDFFRRGRVEWGVKGSRTMEGVRRVWRKEVQDVSKDRVWSPIPVQNSSGQSQSNLIEGVDHMANAWRN